MWVSEFLQLEEERSVKVRIASHGALLSRSLREVARMVLSNSPARSRRSHLRRGRARSVGFGLAG